MSCGFPTEGGINILFLLIGSDVKTLLAYMPQESVETFISYITRLSGESKESTQAGILGLSKETAHGFGCYCGKGQAGVRVSMCRLGLVVFEVSCHCQRMEYPGFFIDLPRCGAKGKGEA